MQIEDFILHLQTPDNRSGSASTREPHRCSGLRLAPGPRLPGPLRHDLLRHARGLGRHGLHLDKPLTGPDCTLFDVLDATAYVTPAQVAKGDTITADYSAFGTVSCHFG